MGPPNPADAAVLPAAPGPPVAPHLPGSSAGPATAVVEHSVHSTAVRYAGAVPPVPAAATGTHAAAAPGHGPAAS